MPVSSGFCQFYGKSLSRKTKLRYLIIFFIFFFISIFRRNRFDRCHKCLFFLKGVPNPAWFTRLRENWIIFRRNACDLGCDGRRVFVYFFGQRAPALLITSEVLIVGRNVLSSMLMNTRNIETNRSPDSLEFSNKWFIKKKKKKSEYARRKFHFRFIFFSVLTNA